MTPDGLAALRAVYEQAVNRPSGALSEQELENILEANKDIGSHLHLTASGSEFVCYQDSQYGSIGSNGVVVLDMIGPIYPRANMMTRMSDAVSVQTLMEEFVEAYLDPTVKGIVLNIDSPGGDARGLSDATAVMSQLVQTGKKPVKAFASGYMASAAYYLGAVADEIVGSRGSYVGSIGTVLQARALSDGNYEITSSQSPYKRNNPASDEGRAVIQEFVDDVAQIMIEDIAKCRGISVDEVLSNYGQGKIFTGPVAYSHGLVDNVGTLQSVIDSVADTDGKGLRSKSATVAFKQRGSAAAEALLAFTHEENIMGLKELVNNFRASATTVFADEQEAIMAQPQTATEESIEPVVAEERLGSETPVLETAPPEAPSRDELESKFSEKAELFATKMVLKSKIMPAEQSYAASDIIIALVDDALVGGSVQYVNADGDVVSGTREEAVQARYESRVPHSFTQKSIVGLKAGSIDGKVLAEEDIETQEESAVSAERRQHLLSLSEQGRKVIAQAGSI